MGKKAIKPPSRKSSSRTNNTTKKRQTKRNESSQSQSVIVTLFSTGVVIVAIYVFQFQYNSSLPSSSTTTNIQSATSRNKHENDFEINPNEKWNTSDPILQNTFNFLSNYVCNDSNQNSDNDNYSPSTTKAYCHRLLQPSPKRRTHYVAKTKSTTALPSKIRRGETVMVLPRHLLIWDLDAMRNQEFIQSQLFQARHGQTGNPLDSGAFLAAFLVYKERQIKGLWTWDNNDGNDDGGDDHSSHSQDVDIPDTDNNHQKLREYLDILPSYEAHVKAHPVLWDDRELIELFGKETVTYELVQAYRRMISSEYQAFHHISQVFRLNASLEDYTRMRINVMSRSFGPGPAGEEEALPGQNLDDELNDYQKRSGVDLKKGCRAMSPILDIWDHHARPNVEWRFDRNTRAFIIKAAETEILPWNDIIVSYGMYTDSHLFAKFGFVNGDGSGHTEISIAIMHQLLDHGLGQQFSSMKQSGNEGNELLQSDYELQRNDLLRYITSDDGYEECIEEEKHPEAYELKRLKFLHLQAIANRRDRWTVKFHPREDSKPGATSFTPNQNEPPRFKPGRVKFDGSKLIETCRLLALTNEDFDGNAVTTLRNALQNGNAEEFQMTRQSDELEYRALNWLARLTNVALKKYPSTVREDMQRLMESDVIFKSKEWYALQTRLGEMQSLESLRSIATSGTRHMMERVRKKKKSVTSTAMFIRRRVCSIDYSSSLIK